MTDLVNGVFDISVAPLLSICRNDASDQFIENLSDSNDSSAEQDTIAIGS